MQNMRLLSFLKELRRGKIQYRLDQFRDDAIMVEVAVPAKLTDDAREALEKYAALVVGDDPRPTITAAVRDHG